MIGDNSAEPDWALPAMRERLARLETRLETLGTDNISTRDRVHALSNEIQRTIGDVTGIARALDRMTASFDTRSIAITTLETALSNHVSGCREDMAAAQRDAVHQREERARFRKELRGYMVMIALAIIGAYLAGKMHIEFPGIG